TRARPRVGGRQLQQRARIARPPPAPLHERESVLPERAVAEEGAGGFGAARVLDERQQRCLLAGRASPDDVREKRPRPPFAGVGLVPLQAGDRGGAAREGDAEAVARERSAEREGTPAPGIVAGDGGRAGGDRRLQPGG